MKNVSCNYGLNTTTENTKRIRNSRPDKKPISLLKLEKSKKNTRLYKTKQVADITFMLAVLFTITAFIMNVIVFAADVDGGATTYQYLADSIYGEHTGVNGPQAAIFNRWAAGVLKWVLPFMNIFAITFMVISMAASIIYLTRPDWFYEVHMLKLIKQQISSNANPVEKVKQLWSEAGGLLNFIKAVFIPDVKALAFSDADEIGPEGKPSMAHFFKFKMPRYIVMVAVIMCINDQTILKFLGTSGNAGAYLMRVAAEYNYATVVKSFVEMGKDYDPGYPTVGVGQDIKNKKIIFNNIYSAIKQYNGFNADKQTTEYLQSLGANIQKWMEGTTTKGQGGSSTNGGFLSQISLDRSKMAVKAIVQPNNNADYSQGQAFATTLSSLTGDGNDAGYVIVTISFGNESRGMAFHETTYSDAWNGNGTSLDLDKVPVFNAAFSKDSSLVVSAQANVQYIANGSVATGSATVTTSGKKLTIAAPGNGEILGVNVVVRATSKNGKTIVSNEAVYFKHPQYEAKVKATKVQQKNK